MDELAPAKINLALHVLARRADGYHELDSVVAFAGLADRLTLRPSDSMGLTISGPFAQDLPLGHGNLVLRAHALLAEHGRRAGFGVPPFHFTLEKNLPVAAGIGGGSADAAAALRLVLRYLEVKLPEPELDRLALRLGADVPVCLRGCPCRMQGIGEQLSSIKLSGWHALVLVNPRVASSTPGVFARLGLEAGQRHGTELDLGRPSSWRNDLQAPAAALVPEIGAVLAALAAEPVVGTVRMSGSGATCFGTTPSLAQARSVAAVIAKRYPRWWVKAAAILE